MPTQSRPSRAARRAEGWSDGSPSPVPKTRIGVARDPVEAAAGDGGPDRSGGVLRDRADVLAREPFAPPEVDEDAVAEAQQPLGPGADPDASLVVLVEAPDVVGGEVSRRARSGRRLPRPKPGRRRGPTSRPRGSPRGRRGAPRPGSSGGGAPPSVETRPSTTRARPPPGGADPDASAGVRGEGDDGVVREPLAGREGPGALLLQPRDAASGGSRPRRPPRGRRRECGPGSSRQLPEGSTRRKPGPSSRKRPCVVRPDPEHAAPVAREGLDLQARQALPGAERLEARRPVIRRRPAAVRPDPEGAVLVGEEGEDRARGELGCRPAVEEGEPGAVESDEPFLGPDPEVAVGRLGDRLDGVLREPLPGLPAVEGRLGERAGRVERESGAAPAGGGGEERGAGRRRTSAPGGAATECPDEPVGPGASPDDRAARLREAGRAGSVPRAGQ